MHKYFFPIVLFVFSIYALPMTGWAEETRSQQGLPGWSTFARGGVISQADADLDVGGSYSANRFNLEVGQRYAWDRRTSVSLAVSYSNDDYSFSDKSGSGISALRPWESVHTFSVSAPMSMGITDNWSSFFIPSLRSTGESSANLDNTLTGVFLAGAAYRFGERLTIGPGIGVVSQLEDDASIFPILIINWKFTDRISLETGRGLAATLGPGLTLNYQMNRQWKFSFGGRYEKLRFRLDEKGDIPDGIGEETTLPLFVNCTYSFSLRSTLSLVAGVEFDGELQVEDADGNRITKESIDPAPFGGITFSLRL